MTNIFKKIMIAAFLFMGTSAWAQAPQKFNYQGIARDAKGNPMAKQQMALKLSVLPTADATVPEYEETQLVTTNEFGLYTLQIGNGTATTGEMKSVKWETGNKYIHVAIDPTGGNNFVDAGTTQLLSVPYALYADRAGIAGATTTKGTRTAGTPWDQGGNNVTTGDVFGSIAGSSVPMIQFIHDGINAGHITWTNTAFGVESNQNNNGQDNTAIGVRAMGAISGGSQNTAIGRSTLHVNQSGENNVANGAFSMHSNTTGSFNAAVGANSLNQNIQGFNNSALGYKSLFLNESGNQNTAVGGDALYTNTTGKDNTALGYKADVSANNLTNATAIGANSNVDISDAMVLGDVNGSQGNGTFVGIGTSSPSERLEVIGKTKTEHFRMVQGNPAPGFIMTSTDALGNATWTNPATIITTTGNSWELNGNLLTGSEVLGSTNPSGSGAISDVNFIYENSPAGHLASTNTAFGVGANELKNGTENTAIGAGALNSINGTSNSKRNTAIGVNALVGNISGENNTAVGLKSLNANQTGNNNSALGIDAGVTIDGFNNTTAIGANAKVCQDNSLILGDNNTTVGIGTCSPDVNTKLDVIGKTKTQELQVTTGAAAGHVLTSDANGNATWQPGGTGNDWSLNGNNATSASVLGTQNQVDLNFIYIGAHAGHIAQFENTSFGEMANPNTVNSNQWIERNTAIGAHSMEMKTTGNENTGIGVYSLYTNTGHANTASGAFSLTGNLSGSNNVATGVSSLSNNTSGGNNVATGFESLVYNNDGSYNSSFGTQALLSNYDGNFNTAIGANSLNGNIYGHNNTTIGSHSDVTSPNLDHATAIGADAIVCQNNSLILGQNGTHVGINTCTPDQNTNLDVEGKTQTNELQVITGASAATAGYVLTDVNGDGNATWQAPTIGGGGWLLAGNSTVASDKMGSLAGSVDPDVKFIRNGNRAGLLGYDNTSWGNNSLPLGNGSANTAIGAGSLNANITGTRNTSIGMNTMTLNSSGIGNVALGAGALSTNTIGDFNTAIGTNSNIANINISNATAIGAGAQVAQSNALILGAPGTNVGINTSAPTSTLQVVGSFATSITNIITTATYTATATDATILIAGLTNLVTLQNANLCKGRIVVIKRMATSGNTTINAGGGTSTIQAQTGFAFGTAMTFSASTNSITFQSDGIRWHRINVNP